MATTTTTPPLRRELEPLPARLRHLKRDHRGYPVPFFVPWIDGVAEFRAMDADKWRQAVTQALCWICGERRGRYQTFVLGPMCIVTRTTAEPPSHHECAAYAVRNCPFLTRPQMVRREDELTAALHDNSAGLPIKRNPGVTALWTTRTFSLFKDHRGKPLLTVGDPDGYTVEWYREGRIATRAEVAASIDSGLPLLDEVCDRDPDPHAARTELARQYVEALRWLPRA